MRSFQTFTVLLLFIFISSTLKSQSGWFPLTPGTNLNLYCITFTSASTGYVSGSSEMILKTTNSGDNWTQVHIGGSKDILSLFFTSESTGYAAGGSPSAIPVILKTTDSGLSWIDITPSINSSVLTLAFNSEQTGIAGTGKGTILKTTNAGNNWNPVNNGGITNVLAALTFSDAVTGYGVTSDTTQIIKSTDGGNNWNIINTGLTGEYYFWSIRFLNVNTGYAIDYYGKIAKTTNGGNNWFPQQSTVNITLRSIYIVNEATAYISGNNGLILKTTNGGINWNQQTSGTSNWLMTSYFTNQNTGYVAGLGGVIRKTTNGGEPIGIKKIDSEIPSGYSLSQNYPNPFNPYTTIRFSIPASNDKTVKLVIYDIIAKEIEVLVNETLSSGVYEVVWDGSNYPSGIYFYQLSSANFSETKKIILIK